jgi:ABC-2 type transport system ATP-binding protein
MSHQARVQPSRPENGQEGLAAAVVLAGLRKVFRHNWTLKTKVAVEALSLTVERGQIFGLLGPNGAGKTTTLKMLLGLLKPTSGQAWLLGSPIGHPESRRRVGYLPENPYFFDRLTAQEFLIFSARLAGLDAKDAGQRADRWLERLGLGDRAKTPLRKFSKGMVQRVGLAHALLHDPELVFLDEPMSGLDPLGRREFRDLILECRDRGTTVVFSSHILPDVELICDRVCVLAHGRMARSGTLDDLLSGEEDGAEIVVMGPLPLLLPPRFAGVSHGTHGQRVRIEVPSAGLVDPLVAHLLSKEYRLVSVTPRRRSLESVVLEAAQSGGEGEASDGQTPERRSRRRAG